MKPVTYLIIPHVLSISNPMQAYSYQIDLHSKLYYHCMICINAISRSLVES